MLRQVTHDRLLGESGVFEVLTMDPEGRELISGNEAASALWKYARPTQLSGRRRACSFALIESAA
jgi:lipocalin